MNPQNHLSHPRKSKGFTLVELLVVAAIMTTVLGLLALSLSQAHGRGVQLAAAQVASGMSLARQIAITRNTDALFIIATRSGTAPTDFFPTEPFRYWAIVYSNRGLNTWTLAQDWSPLPAATVFMGLSGQGYNTLNWSTDGTIPGAPATFEPQIKQSPTGEWQIFNSFTNLTIVWPSGSFTATGVPMIGFRPNGAGFSVPSNPGGAAVAIAEGNVVETNRLLLTTTNNITQVETDTAVGRIIVRPRDSYR